MLNLFVINDGKGEIDADKFGSTSEIEEAIRRFVFACVRDRS
jgi:hypothetical protein